MHRSPTACRPEAFQVFSSALEALDSTSGLIRSAAAIGMHEYPETDPSSVERMVTELAGRVRRRVRSQSRKALLAHLHEVLFVEANFAGNADDYYRTENSYLSHVLDSGRGIPISLAMIYVTIARRLGLRADGINAPGHFLAQVSDGGRPYLVDPFFGGTVLSYEDAYRRIERCLNMPIDRDVELLRPATHRQWLLRMLLNLGSIFDAAGRERDKSAMVELTEAVQRAYPTG